MRTSFWNLDSREIPMTVSNNHQGLNPREEHLSNAFVVFDRDGTLIEHVHHLSDPDLVHFKKDLVPSLQALGQAGYKFGIVSNQSVVGRGIANRDSVDNINNKILNYLRPYGINFDFVYYCPHLPQDGCDCRKPNISLGFRAVVEHRMDPLKSFMVGDEESDLLFGKNLGCTAVQITGRVKVSPCADYYAQTLLDAAKWILAKGNRILP